MHSQGCLRTQAHNKGVSSSLAWVRPVCASWSSMLEAVSRRWSAQLGTGNSGECFTVRPTGSDVIQESENRKSRPRKCQDLQWLKKETVVLIRRPITMLQLA